MPFHVFDPLERLSLWIDHQWPAATSSYNYTVLSGETITRQSLDVPVTYLCRVHKELAQIEVIADRYADLSDLSDPHGHDLMPIAREEGSHVRQERRRNQHVTRYEAQSTLQVLKKNHR